MNKEFSNQQQGSHKKRSITAVLLVALILMGAIVRIQLTVERHYPSRKVEKLLYLPNGKFLKPAVLGFDNLAADYLWLRTIGYFGGHYLADKKYVWLAHILNLVTDLDPRYNIVYYFGGIVLALEADSVDESTALLKKGMKHLPDKWKYPFFIGFNYFYYKGDFIMAARYMEKAVKTPGHPEYLPRLVASLFAKGGRMGAAIEFLERLNLTIDDERLKRNIQGKIDELKKGRLPEGLEKILQERRD